MNVLTCNKFIIIPLLISIFAQKFIDRTKIQIIHMNFFSNDEINMVIKKHL